VPWYQLRSGTLYHAVKAVPPGAVLIDDDTAEDLIAAGQGNGAEGTEVPGEQLGAEGLEVTDTPVAPVVHSGDGSGRQEIETG